MIPSASAHSTNRVALLYGVHGSESVGSSYIASLLRYFIAKSYTDLEIQMYGPLFPWSAARSYRFDSDLVDPNRVFANQHNLFCNLSALNIFHQLWLSQRPRDEKQILGFLAECQSLQLPLQAFLSSPQALYPGLPGYCLSPALKRYNICIQNLLRKIVLGLAPGSPILLIDIHLGIGDHARTTIHADDLSMVAPLPDGSFLGELCLQLRKEGFLPRAFVTETGCLSNLHGLLNLLQELAHRCFSNNHLLVPLRPLVDPTWRPTLDTFFSSDFHERILPLLP
jgi:hypothetical protein